MSQTYVRLADRAIFKSRYGQWYLIDTSHRERERILVEGGAEQVLRFLFSGNDIDAACRSFSLEYADLRRFLQWLVDESVVVWCENTMDSTIKCYDAEPPLDSVNIMLTNGCNLHCMHCCFISGKPMVGELTGDEWIRVLGEVQKLGVFELNISGGEPTLHPDFTRIAEHIASIPTFNANLNTNGFLLRPEHEDVIVRAFTSVQISIDDAVAARHDEFRGRKGSFDRSLDTIGRLVKRGIETNIGLTLTHDNIDILDNVVKLAENLGVSVLSIGLIANLGRASENLLCENINLGSVYDNPFVEHLYRKMMELTVQPSRVRILLPFRIPNKDLISELHEKQFICNGDNTQILYIMANGNIMPCDKLPIEMFSCGNVRQSPILDVWTSQQMKDFKLMNPHHLPRCRICPYLRVCGGACVARAYQNGGSLESPDWISCAIAQKFSQNNMAQR